ncbi:NUDIX domain-containing protein [Sphingomonas sp. 3-13AW]|jgi:nudix-type nucleoside diphosphatase (YffH/AdpP family)|uniref:NUDIX domain-containing protein n=1 Tax=Sphingomonas sp. 3-13AW TaxID=3050450 RepID=UPI003BB7E873
MKDRILETRTLRRGWMDLLVLRMHLNGQEEERALLAHPSGSAVLAYDAGRRVAMTVRQTRAAVLHCEAPQMMEFVAGVVEDEDFAQTALREAEEEVGLRLRALEHVGAVWMSPSSSTERVHLFLAEYTPADRIGEGGGLEAENERLTVREEPLDALWDGLHAGEFADAKALLLLQALRLRRPELFEPAPAQGG